MKDVARLAVVGVLVLSVFAVPLTGSAVAQTDEQKQDCELYGDGVIGSVCDASAGIWSKLLGFDTSTDAGTDVSIDGATSDEVHSDLYSSAGSLKQGSDSILNESRNFIQRVDNSAWSEAKVKIYEYRDEGKSEAEAKEAARKIINDIYSSEQKLILDRMTTVTNRLKTMTETINGTNNLTVSDVLQASDTNVWSDVSGHDYNTSTESYSLVDGSTYNYTELSVRYAGSTSEQPLWTDVEVEATPVDSELSPQPIVEYNRYIEHLDAIAANASDMRTEVETLASDTYANYSQGEIDASQYLSPSDVASQYNLESQNGTAYATAHAALRGYETNASTSMVIEYNSTGATVAGNLYADGDPPTDYSTNNTTIENTWITDHVYDVSQMNATAYMATSSGEFTELQSDFEIVEMEQATTGEPLNYTKPVTYTEYGSYSSDLEKQLKNFAAAMDNRTDTGAGGGLFGGTGSLLVIVALLGVVGGVYMMSKQNGGNGGNGGSRSRSRSSSRVRGRSDANVDDQGRRSYDDAPDGW